MTSDNKKPNGTLPKSKMAAAAIFNFGHMVFLVTWSNDGFYFVSSYKILAKSIDLWRSYGYISEFKFTLSSLFCNIVRV